MPCYAYQELPSAHNLALHNVHQLITTQDMLKYFVAMITKQDVSEYNRFVTDLIGLAEGYCF